MVDTGTALGSRESSTHRTTPLGLATPTAKEVTNVVAITRTSAATRRVECHHREGPVFAGAPVPATAVPAASPTPARARRGPGIERATGFRQRRTGTHSGSGWSRRCHGEVCAGPPGPSRRRGRTVRMPLSRDEQRLLAGIETGLRADDPAFAAKLICRSSLSRGTRKSRNRILGVATIGA